MTRHANKHARPASTPTSHDSQLIKLARQITTLERQARTLTRELAVVRDELKSRRKALKALAQSLADVDRRPDAPPFRMFGEMQEET